MPVIVTSPSIPGWSIVELLGIVYGQDPSIPAVQEQVDRAAERLGANFVVDYTLNAQTSAFFYAYGTAVKAEKL